MTTITVSAADTAQAMDKIVERLGDDALILETIKRDGRIEMVATDESDSTPRQPKRVAHAAGQATLPGGLSAFEGRQTTVTAPHQQPILIWISAEQPITDLLDQQMISAVKTRSAADHLTERRGHFTAQMDILEELRDLRKMLNGMMLTRPEGLDVTLGHSAPVRLQRAGFT